MATLQSTQMTYPPYPVSGPGIGGRSIKAERGTFTGTAASGDVIQMFKLHPRFRVTGGFIKAEDGAVTLTLGDAQDPDRYFVSAAVASGTVNRDIAPTGMDNITGRYTVINATLGANFTGTFHAVLFGYVEEPA